MSFPWRHLQVSQRVTYNIPFALSVPVFFFRWLPGHPPPHPFLFRIPILRMSFIGGDSRSLAGLDAPDFLQLDDSFPFPASSSSLTAHCHSSCATSTCMRDSGSRSPKGALPPPIVTTEKVRIDIPLRPSISTLPPPHSATLRLHPIITATSSNPFHPSHKSLCSTSQSSGTYTLIHRPSSISHLPS